MVARDFRDVSTDPIINRSELNEAEKLQVSKIEAQREVEHSDLNQLQTTTWARDLNEARSEIAREHPEPAYVPDGSSTVLNKQQIERAAENLVLKLYADAHKQIDRTANERLAGIPGIKLREEEIETGPHWTIELIREHQQPPQKQAEQEGPQWTPALIEEFRQATGRDDAPFIEDDNTRDR